MVLNVSEIRKVQMVRILINIERVTRSGFGIKKIGVENTNKCVCNACGSVLETDGEVYTCPRLVHSQLMLNNKGIEYAAKKVFSNQLSA